MKTFEQFKAGYKPSLIELEEFIMEEMPSQDVIKMAQRYPDGIWDTCQNIQNAAYGYTTIYRRGTKEEMEERCRIDYGIYRAKCEGLQSLEKRIISIDETIKAKSNDLVNLQLEVNQLRRERNKAMGGVS